MVKSPGGTITRTVFEARSLEESTWIGTNDTDATDSDPTGNSAVGNNMKKVTQFQYDDGVTGGGGDGNLTKITRPVNDTSANDRITEMEYDWRDRLTTTITDDGVYEIHEIQTLDNLGRTSVVETKREETTPVLIGKTETKYDTRGRVYRNLVYAISDSGGIGNSLQSNQWFDAGNNVIKSLPSGSNAFTKTTFDAIGRPTASYFGYNAGTDDPETLTDNVIFEQTAATYDDANNQTESIVKQRFHNAVGTGALTDPSGAQPKSRNRYLYSWFDEIGRLTETANYGTDDESRQTSAPTPSDTILVQKTEYNARGEAEDITDASGKVTRNEFDDAGRIVKVTANYGSTPNKVTETQYNADGLIEKLIAQNSSTGNQETTYTFGVNTSNSDIASNSLLRQIEYPDGGDIFYEYNRQGQIKKMIDQSQTIQQYEFDGIGRQVQLKVTVVGLGVDGSVRRIQTVYDNRRRVLNITSHSATSGGSVVNDIQYGYNDFGQVTIEYQQHGSAVNTSTSPNVQYGYADGSDNHIRPTSLTYPNDRDVSFVYSSGNDDELSRVSSIKIEDDEIVQYSYLGSRQVVIQKLTEPSTDVELNYATGTGDDPYDGFDLFGRVVQQLWQQGSTKHVDYRYTYDRVGDRLSQDIQDSSTASYDELYDYDNLHRLEGYKRGKIVSGNIGFPTLSQDWTLDQTGNWDGFSQVGTSSLVQTRDHNTVNEITDIDETSGSSWATPVFNAAGNMTGIPKPAALTANYTGKYDSWNRLVQLKDGSNIVAEYEYDGLNRRVIKKLYQSGSLSQTRHNYLSVQNQVLEERVDTSTDADRHFLWGLRFVDDLILRDRETPATGPLDERLYALTDPRFCVLALCDESGTVQERFAYEPFGHSKVLTPAYANRTSSDYAWEYRYTGRELDLDTGINYFRARYYHAELGRFISRDPLGYVDGMSLYRAYFVPSFVDPKGTITVKECTDLVIDFWFDQEEVIDAIANIPTKNKKNECRINVVCECCEGKRKRGEPKPGGYFDPSTSKVVLCANNIKKRDVPQIISQILRHELTHLYDHCFYDVFRDDNTYCERLACAEIRAYSRDGGCNNGGRFRRINESRRDCIARKAGDSIFPECARRYATNPIRLDDCIICEDCSGSPIPPDFPYPAK